MESCCECLSLHNELVEALSLYATLLRLRARRYQGGNLGGAADIAQKILAVEVEVLSAKKALNDHRRRRHALIVPSGS